MADKRRVRRGSGRVTLDDVARAAGVAPMTASHALNSPETVNPAARYLSHTLENPGYGAFFDPLTYDVLPNTLIAGEGRKSCPSLESTHRATADHPFAIR
ncbi:LacI family DNA-binding transcriptional regulator [Paraburkholderia sp. Tr-20389]|nr:LacI family DNA-binding transcriptional regulator [Paraburkholderia sp. Tr-20389]